MSTILHIETSTDVCSVAVSQDGKCIFEREDRPELGSKDTIAPAVSKGNKTLLDWINSEIEALGKENFFHADYEATLRETYGENADADSLVVEGGVI